ncbi:hypothetical protein BpHYR1_044965 [Brachionus plicatilis]|uniref:Uncharacterized protein n=1 Tax=Brachionus plicatilis TaxID=10195 RepID=A0A3M7SYP3_BRAPC|nr:hypothetical protein BpHYR1_044965 [Brachionus plicatilis]
MLNFETNVGITIDKTLPIHDYQYCILNSFTAFISPRLILHCNEPDCRPTSSPSLITLGLKNSTNSATSLISLSFLFTK